MFTYGDVSTTSFHATKLFHTIEGGAVFTKDPDLLRRMSLMRNFGHDGPERFNGVGINGKNSEFHAAMGIVNLRYINDILAKRKEQSERYNNLLSGLKATQQLLLADIDFNYAYYPLVFESEEQALKVKEELEKKEIFPRRYFYPSLSELDYVKGHSPIASDVSKRILCLSLFHELTATEQDMISETILKTYSYA